MQKVPDAGEDEGEVVLVGGGDHLFVSDRAAGGDDRFDSHLGCFIDIIAKREEGVGGHHRSFERTLCHLRSGV